MELSECCKKGFIKKAKKDTNLIASLIEMSGLNEKTIKTAKINETNISSYVVLAYESLREILEAICISKRFKVVSHICLGELLKTIVKNFPFFEFDRMRYIRNGINYYGTKIELVQGQEIIKKIFSMKKVLLKELKGFF